MGKLVYDGITLLNKSFPPVVIISIYNFMIVITDILLMMILGSIIKAAKKEHIIFHRVYTRWINGERIITIHRINK